MEEVPNAPLSASKRQAMYKRGSPMPWKDAYKARCREQLKKSRSKLLQRFRKMEVNEDLNESLSSNVDDVMKYELTEMKENTADEEFDEIIASMEQIKRELIIQEQEMISQYFNNVNYEESVMHDIVNEYDNNSNQNQVICPICKQNPLYQHFTVIKCNCGLSIDTKQDCLNLSHVRLQLQVGTTAHAEQCSGQPIFSASEGFGIQNLLMACQNCDYLFVVL